jgi:hypothetical protein
LEEVECLSDSEELDKPQEEIEEDEIIDQTLEEYEED